MLKKLVAMAAMVLASASWAGVDVNQATAAELDGIKGIGPKLSGKILEERQKSAFKDWNDFITRTPGVAKTRAAQLSKQGLTVGGAAYGAAAPAAAAADTAAPATTPAANAVKEKTKAVKAKATDAAAKTAPVAAKAPAAAPAEPAKK